MSALNLGLPCVGGKKVLLPILKDVLEYIAEEYNTPILIDACGGGGKISLVVSPSIFQTIVYNELELGMTNLFKCLQDEQQIQKVMYLVSKLISVYDNDKRLFENAINEKDKPSTDIVMSAAYTVIAIYGSFSSDRTGYHKATFDEKLRIKKVYLDLDIMCTSTKNIKILNESCLDIIDRVKGNPNILMFIDPPYIQGKADLKNTYINGFSVEMHKKLVSLLLDKETKMKWVLCGFENEIYEDLEKSDNCRRYFSGAVPQSYGVGSKKNNSTNSSENPTSTPENPDSTSENPTSTPENPDSTSKKGITKVDEFIWTNCIIPKCFFKNKKSASTSTDDEDSDDDEDLEDDTDESEDDK